MSVIADRRTYEKNLQVLSEASVERHFDPFVDIAWDDPSYAVDPTDERWILPAEDTLGGSEWYRSLPCGWRRIRERAQHLGDATDRFAHASCNKDCGCGSRPRSDVGVG